MALEINKPTFGDAEMPFPSEATIEPVWISAEHTTLGGKTRRDVMARKYRYTLRWNHMSKAHYEELESAVNELEPSTFTYEKWPQSQSGVSCLGSLSARRLEHGVGNDEFWSSVSLTLTEVENRI